ncbi:DoxX family membrane protein [Ulvibacterium sp.]|uniref:DoxX family membrane protein n=1 Tax=Ulvibacterium sp. TaxID=2665914 RepID=UPI0026228D9F|nr:DoxX family membrane protein [Ulvibacterium sp.]
MRELVMTFKDKMSKNSMLLACIGILYLWFGMLKFFPGVSPAETIAMDTIHELTLGLLRPKVSLILLAIWETGLGLLLIFGLLNRFAILLALVHMILTFTPFLFFPELTFTQAPFGLTLLGQYIMKNIVFLGLLVFLLDKERKKKEV